MRIRVSCNISAARGDQGKGPKVKDTSGPTNLRTAAIVTPRCKYGTTICYSDQSDVGKATIADRSKVAKATLPKGRPIALGLNKVR